MTDGQITNRDIYDRVSAIDVRVAELGAQFREQLRQVAAVDADHEVRIRLLERAKWKAAGAAGTIGALAGGGAGSALSWLLTRHP